MEESAVAASELAAGRRAEQPAPSADARPGGLGWGEYLWLSSAYYGAALLLAVLSRRGLYRFARIFGTLEWLVNFKRRRRFARALKEVLPHPLTAAQRRRWTRDFFVQNRCDRLFYLIFDRIPREQAVQLFDIKNQELLDQALARGRGVYVALSHHGPHHVVGLLMPIRGYKVAGVRDRKEGRMRRFVQARFDRLYPELQRARVLFADGYPREIYRCFQDGLALGSAMDVARIRDPRQRTETVTMFGRPRALISGPLRIALRCRAPVLQGFIIPERGFRYRLELLPLLPNPSDVRDEDAAVRETLERYAANVERQVRARPSLMTRV